MKKDTYELTPDGMVYTVVKETETHYTLHNINEDIEPFEVVKNDVKRYCDVWKDFIDEYCIDDVIILGKAVLAHQKIFHQIGTELIRRQQAKRLPNSSNLNWIL